MASYTIHIPANGDLARAVFVRDGFSPWAGLFGSLWLLWHRHWLAGLAVFAAQIGAALVVAFLDLGWAFGVAADFAVFILMAFESASLRRFALVHRDFGRAPYTETMLVIADTKQEAEIRFFAQQRARLQAQGAAASAQASVQESAVAPAQSAADAPANAAYRPAFGILGLFPHPSHLFSSGKRR